MISLLYKPQKPVVNNKHLFGYSKMSTLNSINKKIKNDSLERNKLIITNPFKNDSGANNPEKNIYRLLAYLSLSLTTLLVFLYERNVNMFS